MILIELTGKQAEEDAQEGADGDTGVEGQSDGHAAYVDPRRKRKELFATAKHDPRFET